MQSVFAFVDSLFAKLDTASITLKSIHYVHRFLLSHPEDSAKLFELGPQCVLHRSAHMEELNRYLQDVESSSQKVATLLHTTLLIKLPTAFLHSLFTIVSVASNLE